LSLEALEETVFEFGEALENYHRYTDKELYEYLKRMEELVDKIILQHRPTKPTDFKFRTFNDMLGEYENVMKAVREAMMSKNYSKVKALLQEVITVVRRMNRTPLFLSSDTMYLPTAETKKELERYVGEGKVAENLHEFDERVKGLSYTAREILSHVFNAPLRELNLRDLPVKLGLTEKGSGRVIGDAVDELVRKLPDMVEVVPDLVRGGMKIRLKW